MTAQARTQQLITRAYQKLQKGDLAGAAQIAQQVLAIDPIECGALHISGLMLSSRGRPREAIAVFEKALLVKPDSAAVLVGLAHAYALIGQFREFIVCLEKVVALGHGKPEVLIDLGTAYSQGGDLPKALACFDKALAADPRNDTAWLHRSSALYNHGRFEEAIASCDEALAINPNRAESWSGRAVALNRASRYAEEAQALRQMLRVDPHSPFAPGRLLFAQMMSCDWNGITDLRALVTEGVRKGRKAAHPFGFQSVSQSESDLQACAQLYSAALHPAVAAPSAPQVRTPPQERARLRIGYLSGEFRHQATSILMVNLFERHSRHRFEIFAFDNGHDDGSETRQRLAKAFTEIVAISRLSDAAAVAAIHEREIDILVNLNGFFGKGRQSVFSRRPCPIQVNYLGFPGTIGAPYIDYIIADRIVIPAASRPFYVEKVVHLPDTYQVNDAQRHIADTALQRADCGLPPDGFVFACFNNSYKITPETFGVWMKVLARVPGSVLWLLSQDDSTTSNLRREAEQRGVEGSRLVFAGRLKLEEHLARHRLADLFLDTLPYNAHTTASDALWAGLPLLTRLGTTFPGRVAASLLHAVGLPELVTRTEEEYESLAVELATQPQRLAEIRARLARNRLTYPLFDTARFTTHLEAAYEMMWDRHARGLPPDHLEVVVPDQTEASREQTEAVPERSESAPPDNEEVASQRSPPRSAGAR